MPLSLASTDQVRVRTTCLCALSRVAEGGGRPCEDNALARRTSSCGAVSERVDGSGSSNFLDPGE